ncbi:hypothetical protein J437_LFUL004076, partial [Ladona fulva]
KNGLPLELPSRFPGERRCTFNCAASAHYECERSILERKWPTTPMDKRNILAAMAVAMALTLVEASTQLRRETNSLIKLYTELKNTVVDLWDDIEDPRWHAVMAANELTQPEEEILRSFAHFGDLLANTVSDREIREQRKALLSSAMGDLYAWTSSDAQIGTVDSLYQSFRRFQINPAAATATEESKRAFTELAETILRKDPPSVTAALSDLHELVTDRRAGVFVNVPRVLRMDGGNGQCSIHQSPKQLIYNLYNVVALTEIKGYAMMQFSWMLLKLYNKGNFTLEAELMKERVEARMKEKIEAAQKSMENASPEFWVCDPNHHEENVTYVQLTKLLQGHVVNEVDLNAKGSCRENCAYYSYARTHGCYKGLFCNKQPKCNGRLFDCRFIDSDSSVCLSNSNDRKYDWIEYENGRTLGKKASCSRGSTKVDSWWRWLFWHCSYCFCMCDEQGPNSDRYFSLHAAMAKGIESDGGNSNRVVTGLRFVKVNRVVHLQIQDGVVLPGGMINASTLEWQPIKPFKPSDPGIIRGVDFHMMSWEQRAIDLDDLSAPEGSVLTGVKLRIIGSHLNLEILATPINISTGHLSTSSSVWVGNDNTPASMTEPRKQVTIDSPDVPTKCPVKSSKLSNSDQFVKFTHSDINSDVAQTTVPFIDAQPVVLNPPSLLVGAGLLYKACTFTFAQKVITTLGFPTPMPDVNHRLTKDYVVKLKSSTTVICSDSNHTIFEQTELEKLHDELKKMTGDLWGNINDPRWYAALAFSAHRNIIPPDQHILQAFARFGDKLEASGLDREMKILRQKLLSGAMGNLYVWASSDAQIGMIDALYEAFRRFQVRTAGTAISEATRRAFTDLAETILQDDPDSVPTSISKLHDLMTILEGGGVFGNTPRVLSEVKQMHSPSTLRISYNVNPSFFQNDGINACDMHQSPQQLVYNIYNIASLTDLKGHAMMQFSWMLLSLYNIGNYTMEARAMEDRMRARMIEKKAALRRVMPQCSNEFWKCDPLNYAENVTYTKLTNLLQGHVQNEIDMSTEVSQIKITVSKGALSWISLKGHYSNKGRIIRYGDE